MIVQKGRNFVNSMNKLQKRLREKIETKDAKAGVIVSKWDLVQSELIEMFKKNPGDEELGLFIQKILRVRPEIKLAVCKKFM
jgi:hypothetical protein